MAISLSMPLYFSGAFILLSCKISSSIRFSNESEFNDIEMLGASNMTSLQGLEKLFATRTKDSVLAKHWLLQNGDKPWVDDDMRKKLHEQSQINGAHIFGDKMKSRWLVMDDVLSEQQCAALRDMSDSMERDDWAKNPEEQHATGVVGTKIRTHDHHTTRTDLIVEHPEKCLNNTGCHLFLNTRHLMAAATRTFFEEAHFIHPELTTLQRRSRPPSHTGTVHQGAHADSCQIDFEGSTPRCGLKSNNGFIHRTHTAVLYLSDYSHAKGGELFMTDTPKVEPPMNERSIIPLKCGRMVVFESGPQNIHGVNTFETGNRYAIDLWFATHPGHFEATGKAWTKLAPWELSSI